MIFWAFGLIKIFQKTVFENWPLFCVCGIRHQWSLNWNPLYWTLLLYSCSPIKESQAQVQDSSTILERRCWRGANTIPFSELALTKFCCLSGQQWNLSCLGLAQAHFSCDHHIFVLLILVLVTPIWRLYSFMLLTVFKISLWGHCKTRGI